VRLHEYCANNDRWTTNQKDSLFLRLPGEVRNTIYQYALGGKTINIQYETYRTTYKFDKVQKVTPVFKYHWYVTACEGLQGDVLVRFATLVAIYPKSPAALFPKDREHTLTLYRAICSTVYHKKPANPFSGVSQPYKKVSTSFTPLNNICRQLYHETAALPYKLNMFGFDSHNIMFNFLVMEKRLSRQQLEAITQIVLPNEVPGSNMLGLLRSLEKVWCADDENGKAKGWHYVVRQEGEKPKLQRKLQ
jgi:hypothetical protein